MQHSRSLVKPGVNMDPVGGSPQVRRIVVVVVVVVSVAVVLETVSVVDVPVAVVDVSVEVVVVLFIEGGTLRKHLTVLGLCGVADLFTLAF